MLPFHHVYIAQAMFSRAQGYNYNSSGVDSRSYYFVLRLLWEQGATYRTTLPSFAIDNRKYLCILYSNQFLNQYLNKYFSQLNNDWALSNSKKFLMKTITIAKQQKNSLVICLRSNTQPWQNQQLQHVAPDFKILWESYYT